MVSNGQLHLLFLTFQYLPESIVAYELDLRFFNVGRCDSDEILHLYAKGDPGCQQEVMGG
jgi:hypothetical protein